MEFRQDTQCPATLARHPLTPSREQRVTLPAASPLLPAAVSGGTAQGEMSGHLVSEPARGRATWSVATKETRDLRHSPGSLT